MNPLGPALGPLLPSLRQAFEDKSTESQKTEKFSSPEGAESDSTDSLSSSQKTAETSDDGKY